MTRRNYLKTTLLLAAMSGLLLGIGALLGGNWITIALVAAIAMNGFAYFFSDKIAIRAAGAVPVSEAEFPELHRIVSGLAATVGAVITWVSQLALFFGGGDDEEGGVNPIAALFMALLAPISATIIQLSISRGRELGADSSGARITGDPLALASALRKIEAYSRGTPPATANPSTAHLFISSPFQRGAGVTSLFSTHPSTAERVRRLEHMASLTQHAPGRAPHPRLTSQAQYR
ncbi:MAG TPA: M48 family metalloprotease [Streptosporangiaceae bacterium]|nr:M48 family metalloprotease [Streptosporangiaceae bacterium]